MGHFSLQLLLHVSDKPESCSPIRSKTSNVSSDDDSSSNSPRPSVLNRLGNRTVEDSSKPSLKSRLSFKTDATKDLQTESSPSVLKRPGGLNQRESSVGMTKKTDLNVVSISAGKRLGGKPDTDSKVSPPSGPSVRKFGLKSKVIEKTVAGKPQGSAPSTASASHSSSPQKSSPLKLFLQKTAAAPVSKAGHQLVSSSSSSSSILPQTQPAAEHGRSHPTTVSTSTPAVHQPSRALLHQAMTEVKKAAAESQQGEDRVDIGLKTPIAPPPVHRQTSGEKSHPEGKRRSSSQL